MICNNWEEFRMLPKFSLFINILKVFLVFFNMLRKKRNTNLFFEF